MSFIFQSENYAFKTRWSVQQQLIGERILELGVKNKYSTSTIIGLFEINKISYRRTDMLHDIAMSKAIERSSDIEKYGKSEAWFDTIEKIRELKPNLNRIQAIQFYEKWKNESIDNLEDLEYIGEIESQDYYTPHN